MRGTVVIGLGNPLMGVDGFGLAALEQLRAEWRTDDAVSFADGGTWGMSLLPLVEDADRLILLDAISAGATPGSVVVLERDRLPIYLTRKLSPHQVDMRDVLAVAEWCGSLPSETVAIGVQPELVELRIALSAPVSDAMSAVTDVVIQRLRAWGHCCERVTPGLTCTR